MSMEESLDLPPGFRFHPTDEEIVTHYLSPKVVNHGAFTARAIGEVDLNKCEPWDLPAKAKLGEKELYFFCQKDRKYPTGMRTNRATESGYWKATGKDKEIYRGRGVLIGMKKTLVFYRGRAPKGIKTNWVMHEFRLEGKSPFANLPKSAKDEWVVSRVFHKNSPGQKKTPLLGGAAGASNLVRMNSFSDELIDSPNLPPLTETPYLNSGFADVDNFDVKTIMASSAPLNNYYYCSMINAPYSSNHLPSSSYQQQIPYSSAMKGQQYCKAEQFSNQSMISQDTGDRNTEISSVVSKLDMASCASYGGGGVMDLANMWRC